MSKRSKQLNIRLNEAEMLAVSALADQTGLSVADVVRLALRKYASLAVRDIA